MQQRVDGVGRVGLSAPHLCLRAVDVVLGQVRGDGHGPTLAAVLSEDNRALLRLIHDQRPPSLTALAELTGRQVPNLSRTLRMMESYGLVALKKSAREIAPVALATSYKILID